MKAFRSFDDVTTPERWKQRALEISGYEKPKLKKTYDIAVVAAAAVFAVGVVAVNSFVKFGSTDSLDEDLTPEVTAQAPAASGEDAFEDAVVSQSDERYNIAGSSDGREEMVYTFNSEGVLVACADDTQSIIKRSITENGFVFGYISRMEKNEKYTTLYLSAENSVCAVERDEHIYVIAKQCEEGGYIREVVKVRVRNDMLPSDNFSGDEKSCPNDHKLAIGSVVCLFFDRDKTANDIANGEIPEVSQYYIASITPFFFTENELGAVERFAYLAGIASDFGRDKQLKEDLILGQLMNIDKEMPGLCNEFIDAEKLVNTGVAVDREGIVLDMDGDTAYLIERLIPYSSNDTQTSGIEGKESETGVSADGTDFSNAQAVFNGTDSADIMNGGDKICEVKVSTNFGGKVKDIKIVHDTFDSTEMYIITVVENIVGAKDEHGAVITLSFDFTGYEE